MPRVLKPYPRGIASDCTCTAIRLKVMFSFTI